MTWLTLFLQFTFATLTTVAPAFAGPIYVASAIFGVVEYDAATGAAINPNLISGVTVVNAIALSGNTLFVASNGVGEYDATTGAAINANFISGLNPSALAVSGNTLFVANSNFNGTVGEYDATTGAAINANFISGLRYPSRLAVSANTLFVSSAVGLGEFNTTTGAAINANLIPGLAPTGLAVSGNTLFVASWTGALASIGEYNATTGGAINPKLITLAGEIAVALALVGNNLLVADSHFVPGSAGNGLGGVGEYDATTGAAIKGFALARPSDIATSPSTSIPEPSTRSLIAVGGLLLLGITLWRNRPNAGMMQNPRPHL